MLAVFYKFKDTRYGRVVLLAFFLIAMTPFVSHYYLSRRSTSEFDFYVTSFHTRSALEDNDRSLYRIDELKRNVDELERVKLSLKNELRELEGKRHSLLREIQEYSNNVEEIRTKATRLRVEVQRRQQELEDLRLVKKEMNDCPQLPFLKPSKDLLPRLSTNFETYPRTTFQQTTDCSLSSCFNFQKCSFLDDFTAHVYNPDKLVINLSSKNKVAREIYYLLKSMPYSNDVSKPISCIYVVIIGPFSGNMSITAKELENSIYKLPFWQGDGHNHILMNFAGDQIFKGVNIGRAMLAQTSFGTPIQYRQNFDILIPPLESLLKTGPAWAYSEPQLPARRKYLLSFEGNHEHLTKTSRTTGFVSNEDLKQLSSEAKDLHIQLNCQVDEIFSKKIGWQVCGTHASRASVLKKSTYTLILQSEHTNDQTMSIMRFIEALQYGAIPVVLKDNIILPFQDMINWQQASVMLYNAQLPQVHFILRTISVNDLLEMRRQGRFLWETYLSTTEAVLATILGTMRTWLSLPAKPFKGINFPSAFSEENKPIFNSLLNSDSIVEHPMRSPTFFRNFTLNNVFARHTWNTYPGALVSFPSEPFVPVLPSSTAFHNSSTGFQPIGKGAGGAGVEFQKALGGDYPIEQFTIVMLTYERELVLMEALGRLAGLQHLNKVIVVWNSPQDPSPDLKWPSIGVPIHVLQPQKNSLNNRFLPHDQIETDAILSMDDDAHLRQDEISFGFRVWREARDRIVGFPGRFHSWDLNYGGWLYNSNYSCELSMVLTGAAFFHKYYAYLYSYVMPEAIRNKVDEYTNCEDIAMNFLVSHVTRKPPIKVTSRWTFRCPGCPQTLSQDETHFNERHNCINFFVKVYGYMPLLRTQFRADSVLFKTRLPHDKTKCYTYI